jgi:AcrR family transcriptional regulator
LEKISTEKRLEILTAAKNLFAQKGFERSTVEEIAARANVGKGTVYLYFENKEQIFMAILEQGLVELQNLFADLPSNKDFYQKLYDIIYKNLAYVETHHEFYRLFLKERLTVKLLSDAHKDRLIMEKYHAIFRKLAELMQQGMDQGYVRPGDPLDYGIAIGGILNHFASFWIMREPDEPLTAKSEMIWNLILNGIKKCG